jgi:hypothetical protein
MTEELTNKLHRKSVARSIIQIESPEQNLTFRQLLIHYSGKNKSLLPGLTILQTEMRIFKDLGILEGLGLGMRGIVEVYGRKIFEFTENTLYVNIPFDKEVMESAKRVDIQEETTRKQPKHFRSYSNRSFY